MTIDRMTIDRMTIDRMTIDKMIIDKMTKNFLVILNFLVRRQDVVS